MNTRRSALSVLLAVLLLPLLAACLRVPASGPLDDGSSDGQGAGGSEDSADDIAELQVVETAFGLRSDYYWYVALIENPNPDHIFVFEEVTVEAYDADGVILDSSSTYVTILQGTTALTGTFFDVGSETIDRIEVRGPTPAAAVSSPQAETGSFTIAELAATSDSYSTTVSGILSSTFVEEQELVEVVVVARSNGAIVGADFTFVDRLPVDGKVRFEATFFELFPSGTTFEAFASQ